MTRFIASLRATSREIFVVQRYVDRPLLLSHRRKFDIRVWVLLTSPYCIYVYSQGACRTSSTAYDITDIHNTLAHLTNHCLQEGHPDFGRYEEGNELWLPEVKRYLEEDGGKPACFMEATILPQIEQIVVRTLLAARAEMQVSAHEPYRCFQLFGYDLLLTEEGVVMLLEINGSPGVAQRYLDSVVSAMLHILASSGGGDADDADMAQTGKTSPPSTWGLDLHEFVLLWKPGDAVPEGLDV